MPLFGKKGPPEFLIREWKAGGGSVKRVAISPDEQIVVAVGDDGAVKVWDLASGALRAALGNHPGGAEGLSLSADGSVAASCGQDDTIRIWDLPDGRLRREMGPQKALGCALAPDGSFVVAGGLDTLKVWDVATGQERSAFAGHTPIQDCAVAPDGSYAVAASIDLGGYRQGNDSSSLKVWDIASGWSRITVPFSMTGTCGVSGDGSMLVSTSLLGFFGAWNPQTGEQLRLWKAGDGNDMLVSFALGHDGTTVVTGESSIKVWNLAGMPSLDLGGGSLAQLSTRTGTERPRVRLGGHAVRGQGGATRGLAVARSGRILVSGGADGAIRVWDLAAALAANP